MSQQNEYMPNELAKIIKIISSAGKQTVGYVLLFSNWLQK